MVKQATKEAFILILTAIGIALAVYTVRSDKIEPVPSSQATGDAAPLALTKIGIQEISLEDALHLFKQKDAIFADSRHRADFEAGHIPGAIHLYVAEPDAWLPDFLPATDPLAMVVTYCDGRDCQLAEELAELLSLNGFENVRYLRNGWSRWFESGFPVEN